MARKYHTYVREEKAVEICVDVTDLETYKTTWLWLHNNAREYPHSIYKVWNNSHDSIYVLANPNSAKELKSILEEWGTIRFFNEDKTAVFIDIECDYDDFDKDYIDSEYILGEED